MNHAKNDIIASITRAKLELDDAMEDLKSLPMLDPLVLGFIAHALNNYLQISFATLALLADALRDNPDEDVGIWIKGLQDITGRMRNLVDEIQHKPQKATPQMNFEKFDLATMVGRACDFYRVPAGRKHIEILYEKPSPPVPKVRADRIAVAAVLDNLLSNAIKFSPSHKKVTVEMRHDDGKVTCSFRDEGPGITPEDHSCLFQRGAQLKAKPTGGEPSTGYGLAVAAELIAHLGGEIGCESEPGNGACFYFRLPAPRSRPAHPAARAAQTKNHKSRKQTL